MSDAGKRKSLKEQSWRHRLLFVCALAPVCFSFSPMNKEGLYGVNGTLFLYNYSFLSLVEP